MKMPWKVNSRKRGAGILTVLTAGTLLLLLGLTVAGTSFHHLSVSNRLHHSQIARNLAEAYMAKAVAQILKLPTNNQGPTTFTPVLSPSQGNDQSAFLTFDPTQVTAYNANLRGTRLVRSYNNISGTSSVQVEPNIVIPAESLYVRAVGVDHGVERAMECVLWVPPFPYSMAAGDKITLAGDSQVAALENVADLSDPSKWLPGSLVTNSNGATDAVTLNDNVKVKGDVQAVGGATIAATSTVAGETRLHSSAVRIPTLRIEDYDTHLKTGVTTYSSSTPASNQVNGFAYRSGALNFNTGLSLNNGVVYVDGDLSVTGPISGQGAVIATGKVTINGSGSIVSNNKVAIMSKQDMTLSGTAANHLGAQGLLYTGGKLKADYADIVGGVAAPTDTTGQIEFTNVNMLQQSTSTTLTMQVGGPPQDLTETDLSFNSPISGTMPTITRGAATYTLPFSQSGVSFKLAVPDRTRFKDSATGQYHMPVKMDYPRDINGNPMTGGLAYETVPGGPNGSYQVPSSTTVLPLKDTEMVVTVENVDYPMSNYSVWQPLAEQAMIDHINAALPASQQLTPGEIAGLRAVAGFYYGGTSALSVAVPLASGFQTTSTTKIYTYDQALASSSGPGETVTFTLDPLHGNFLNLAQDIRILYWREVPQ